MPDKIGSTSGKELEYGEPHKFDPEFKGPLKNRSCTDILCLLLFVLFIIGWIIVAAFAGINGDPGRLIYPTDSKGRVCGRDATVQDKPYLLFFDLTKCASPKVPFTGCPTPQVCVKSCPTENWFFLPGSSHNKSKLYCKEGTDMSKSINDLIYYDDCAAYYIDSRSIAHRCIPRSLYNFTNNLLDSIVWQSSGLSQDEKFSIVTDGLEYVARFVKVQQVAEGVVKDIRRLWPFLLIGCGIAMIVSFLWILLLRLVAKFMVWMSLILFTGLCGFVAYYTFDKYMKVRNKQAEVNMTATEKQFMISYSKVADVETTWLVFFIITVSIFVICLFILIFLRKRIALAIALINEASKAVGCMMSTLFFPIFPYLLHIVFLLFFCVVALLLVSAGVPTYRLVCNGECNCPPLQENSTCYPSNFSALECPGGLCQFYSYETHPVMPRLHIYNIFALFWTMCFVSAFCEMVLAGAFSSYYWSFKKPDDIPTFPVLNSIGRTCRYHLGTLAFGSLIIAIIRFIRLIFEYIDYKLRKHTDSTIVKVLMCLCRCCLWCLEKFLKFVNRNAYIYCAIYGKNFCTSARKSFSMLMRNVLRVVVLDKVTDFLLLIGKLVVTGGMALLSFFFFSGGIVDRGRLPAMNYYLTPVILIAVATFFIASAFFDVYNMAVDTLFFCFLEDSERNDGSPEKPYFMSKDLKKILGKSNKGIDD